MTKATQDRRVAALRNWLSEAARELDADLSVKLWNGEVVALGTAVRSPVAIAINSPDAVRRLIFSPKLVTVVKLYAEGLLDVEGGSPLEATRGYDHMRTVRFARSLSKVELAKTLWPFVRAGAREGDDAAYGRKVRARFGRGREDQAMIAHHYDVGNAFYELLLGPEMVYSPGYFESRDMDLATAEKRKLEVICRKLRMTPGDRFLDIGCGWGALACHAAREHGAHVLGVTLSREQFEYARARVKREGLEDRVTIELKDYREVPVKAQFDKVSQVGMSEHLGIDNHDAHFQRVHDLLKPRGLHFHEAITRPAIHDIKNFRKPTGYQDVISRYIFPGGELDHIGLTCTNMERHRLEVVDVENVREHYERTCEIWVERLWANREAAVAAADEQRVRLWLFYLSMSAVGFARGACGTFQVVASRRRTGSLGLEMSRRGALD